MQKLLAFVLGLLIFASGASALHAADGGGAITITNPLIAEDIPSFIAAILDVVIKIGFMLAVFFLMYAGFLFVTAQGNEEKISTAKTAFLWTVVGVAVLLGAKVLANVVCGTLNEIGTGGLKCKPL